MPPTPRQSLQRSIEAMQLQMQVEEHRWTARGRVVVKRMEQYLDETDSPKVEAEELEHLLGPEDSEVDVRHI